MSDTAAPRRRIFPRLLLTILAVLLLALAVLLSISILDRRSVTDVLPDEFSAYFRVASAGDFFESLLSLDTADALLAAPEAAPARALLVALRTEPFLRGRHFRTLTDVRMDGAFYGTSYLAVIDLGMRSAVTRLVPFLGPWIDLPGLSFTRSSGISRFAYKTGDTILYAAAQKNLLLVSGDEALLESALLSPTTGRDAETAKMLAGRAPRQLRILLRTRDFLVGFEDAGDPLGRLLQSLHLPGFTAVDLSVSNTAVQLSMELPVSSDIPAINAIISARSRPPAVLSALPASTQYFSILSAGRLRELKDAALVLLGPDARQAWTRADSASRAALGADLEEILLSWTGDELGAFGLAGKAEPVFFIKVGDEARRRKVFQSIFETGTLGEDAAVVLDGIRVPRIVFPWYIHALLSVLGADVPQPYYLSEDGYFLLSASAEALVATARDGRAGEVLPRTDSWRRVSEGIPSDSAAMIYYSLDRSVPFFLRGQGSLAAFLRQYGEGTGSVRFEDGRMRLALSAVSLGGRGVQSLPGFPFKTNSRPVGGIQAGRAEDRRVRLYWLDENKILTAYQPAAGTRKTVELDDTGDFVLETRSDGTLTAVWAVSRRGSVWRLDPDLAASDGFPLATGARPAAAPTLSLVPKTRDSAPSFRLLVPLRDGGILTVSPKAEVGSLPITFDDPVSAPLAHWNGRVAAYPKGFEGAVWVLDAAGAALPGWPVRPAGLGYGSPALVALGDSFRAAFLTQAGEFSVWNDRGETVPGFPVSLDGVFYGTPVFAADAFWAVSVSGALYRIGMDGRTTRLDVKGLGGREPVISARDINRDGIPEIFVTGEGNAVYAFTSSLESLAGFPVPGTGRPAFADINGDGLPELLSSGVDGTIQAVSFKGP